MIKYIRFIFITLIACLCFIFIDNVFADSVTISQTGNSWFANGGTTTAITRSEVTFAYNNYYQYVTSSSPSTIGNGPLMALLYDIQSIDTSKYDYALMNVCGLDLYPSSVTFTDSKTFGYAISTNTTDSHINPTTSYATKYCSILKIDLYGVNTLRGLAQIQFSATASGTTNSAFYVHRTLFLGKNNDNVQSSIDKNTDAIKDQTESANKNAQQAHEDSEKTQQAIDGVNDTLSDGSVDSPDGAFSDMESSMSENGVITNLVTMPITLYQSILNSVNSSCTSFNLGNLLGTDLVLPCIDISKVLGGSLWSVIDILFSGFFIFTMSKKFIATFNQLSNMEEGDILD